MSKSPQILKENKKKFDFVHFIKVIFICFVNDIKLSKQNFKDVSDSISQKEGLPKP